MQRVNPRSAERKRLLSWNRALSRAERERMRDARRQFEVVPNEVADFKMKKREATIVGEGPGGAARRAEVQMATGLVVEQKPPVCIAGMHRSGTSLITRLLHICGLDLGQERDIITPRAKEPRAYWENDRFVRLNEQILREMGGGAIGFRV